MKRHKENEAKATSVPSDVRNKSSESLKCEEETSIVNISCLHECKTPKGHSEKQPDTFQNVNTKSSVMDSLIKEDASHILFDKRKSWAVEELVAELSKMKTERSCYESSSAQPYDEEHLDENSVTSCSSHVSCSSVHSCPDDNHFCSNKHSLSVTSDKADNCVQGSKKDSEVRRVDISDTRVSAAPYEGSKNVEKVIHKSFKSWEKLAQEVQVNPAGTVNSRASQISFPGSLNEPSTAVDNTKMESAFRRMKNKLVYSGSFKVKKDKQHVLKRRSGNSVLSTSWENALSECKESKGVELIPDEKKLTNSEHVSSALIGLDRDRLKSSHSGSDLEVLQKESGQHGNVLHQGACGDKSKGISVVSGSESEENLDEGSTSGLSDDVLCKSVTSKGYSDISDGAVSDDLQIESLDKVTEVEDGSSSHVQLQKKQMPLPRKYRVR